MEDSLGARPVLTGRSTNTGVLILVVMEDSLGVAQTFKGMAKSIICLNPCCYGR